MTEAEVVCGSCGAVSFPPRTTGVHEAHCPLSPQNHAANVEVNGQPAKLIRDPMLINLTLEQLVDVVDDLQGKVAIAASERGRASNKLKEAQKARDKALGEMLARRREDLGKPALPLGDVEEEDEGG